jgi:transcriptional regulator with XRE-family HTH domain
MSNGADQPGDLPSGSMTGDELASFGSLAYGAGWQTALAADFGLSRATVNRWAQGRFRISEEWALTIRALCLKRARRRLDDLTKLHRRAFEYQIELRKRALANPDVTAPEQRPWRPLSPFRGRD